MRLFIPRTLAKKGTSRHATAFGTSGVTTSLGHNPVSSTRSERTEGGDRRWRPSADEVGVRRRPA